MRRAGAGVLAVALLAGVFLSGTFAAPWLEHRGLPGANLLRAAYGSMCHQQAERSLGFGSAGPQAVCARCCGLYLGGFLGLLLGAWLTVRGRSSPRPGWLAVVAAPTAVDAGLPWVGLAGLDEIPRLLLALPLGGVAALFLAHGLADLFALAADRGGEPVRTGSSLEVVDG